MMKGVFPIILLCFLVTISCENSKQEATNGEYGQETLSNVHEQLANNSRNIIGIPTLPSCKSLNASGLIFLQFLNKKVYCEMDSYGGGWLVIQQRVNFKLDFNRNWTEYRNGFGVVGKNEDFWLGLEAIHQLTNDGQYELIIESSSFADYIYDPEGNGYARYSQFRVAAESDKYRLTVGDPSGILEDFFIRFNNNMKFTTYDSDNDDLSSDNCAKMNNAGWWFDDCGPRSLNSPNPTWHSTGAYSKMMIRRK